MEPRLLSALQIDLPLTERPFAALAEPVGLTEAELLAGLAVALESGEVRRYGARVQHRALGFTANAMVVWAAPPARVEEAGRLMAQHPAVSHCYERPTFDGFPYNLYTMIHGRRREECEAVAEELARATGLSEWRSIYSRREFKKQAPSFRSDLRSQI